MQFNVTAYVNVHPDNFFGFKPDHPIALVGAFTVKADDTLGAAREMWVIGNRMGCDLSGNTWPTDVRSMSVGDFIKVITPPCNDHPSGAVNFYACASIGWDELLEPTNPIVSIEGTRATSRT